MSFNPMNLRRPQYRLATLFMLVAVISVPLAASAWRERQYQIRLQAVQMLQDKGDIIIGLLPDSAPDDPDPCYSRPLGENGKTLQKGDVVSCITVGRDLTEGEVAAILRLRTVRALDFTRWGLSPPIRGSMDAPLCKLSKLPRVEWLKLEGSTVTDDGVGCLGGLRSLRSLSLSGTRISGVTLGHLSALRKLEELNLRDTNFTDEGARHLVNLTSLRDLDVAGTEISDVGLKHIAALRELWWLDLSCTKVSDAGVRYLSALTSLSFLHLSGTRVSDAALPSLSGLKELHDLMLGDNDIANRSLIHLAELPKLAALDLPQTKVSDAGLAVLTRCRSLERLNLDACRGVSDAGMIHLSRIKPLKYVFLDATAVTAAGIAQLKRLKPGIEVYRK